MIIHMQTSLLITVIWNSNNNNNFTFTQSCLIWALIYIAIFNISESQSTNTIFYEQFQYAKCVIRSRKSKDRHCNDIKRKKTTNNDLWNTLSKGCFINIETYKLIFTTPTHDVKPLCRMLHCTDSHTMQIRCAFNYTVTTHAQCGTILHSIVLSWLIHDFKALWRILYCQNVHAMWILFEK